MRLTSDLTSLWTENATYISLNFKKQDTSAQQSRGRTSFSYCHVRTPSRLVCIGEGGILRGQFHDSAHFLTLCQ